jgi:hypothetical protein
VEVNILICDLACRSEVEVLQGKLKLEDNALIELLRDRVRFVDERDRLEDLFLGEASILNRARLMLQRLLLPLHCTDLPLHSLLLHCVLV